MQATITYLLTEQAQLAQMVATGQPVARKQEVTVEVPAQDLELMQITQDGRPYLDLSQPRHPHLAELEASGAKHLTYNEGAYIAKFPHYGADVLQMIRAGEAAIIAERSRKQAEERAKVELYDRAKQERASMIEGLIGLFLADPKARGKVEYGSEVIQPYRLDPDSEKRFYKLGWDNPSRIYKSDPRYVELLAEVERRNATDKAETERASESKERVKSDFIAAWIRAHADEQTREQFDDGLLCRNAAITLIADGAFESAGVPRAGSYNGEFCDSNNCPCGSRTVDCLPRSTYPRWKEIKANLPEGYTVEFSRVRECLRGDDWDGEGESAGDPIYLAEIKLPYGPFVFERTIQLV